MNRHINACIQTYFCICPNILVIIHSYIQKQIERGKIETMIRDNLRFPSLSGLTWIDEAEHMVFAENQAVSRMKHTWFCNELSIHIYHSLWKGREPETTAMNWKVFKAWL
jgi:hypothetical protein